MYRYDEFDHAFVAERVAQFRDQVARCLSGELSEDQFKPLRLMNGLYLQLHAYMLRVAVPYGTLSGRQMRKLADIADKYDKGYGHFTTRQNIQFNWPTLVDVPAILDDLAEVEMHAIQTSGNTIRNTTADPWAGVAADELEDPRPYAELIRQWSSLHPEFSFLPRKFKVAVTGAANDRAAIAFHDIGLRIKKNKAGESGFEVLVGGGMGRTPMLGKIARDWLPKHDLLSYLEAILRVYNANGRRDNKYKARIKILVHEIGLKPFQAQVEDAFAAMQESSTAPSQEALDRIAAYFAAPDYETLAVSDDTLLAHLKNDRDFAAWHRNNVAAHKVAGYAIVNISLKPIAGIPGDATSDQMRCVGDIADRFSHGEIRVTHAQNLVLPYVRQVDVHHVWKILAAHDLAAANIGLATDIISCPGMDYCALATARSIPIAQAISERLKEHKRQEDIGGLEIKISGCINACGHHHAGHIGILGLEKKGVEFYQVTLGGAADDDASVGKIIGPGFSADGVVDAVETIVETYRKLRTRDEPFIGAVRRLGIAPFKEAVYAAD